MRRFWVFMLLCMLAIALCACKTEADDFKDEGKTYYYVSDSGTLDYDNYIQLIGNTCIDGNEVFSYVEEDGRIYLSDSTSVINGITNGDIIVLEGKGAFYHTESNSVALLNVSCSVHRYMYDYSCVDKVCAICGEGFIPATTAHSPNNDCLCAVCGKTVHGLKNGNYCIHNDEVYCGEYPTTKKIEGVKVGSAANTNGYYYGSDGCCYSKTLATPCGKGHTFSDGSEIVEREGGAQKEYYFAVEPIKWRIIDKNEGTVFLLCDLIIEGNAYQTDVKTREDGNSYVGNTSYYANNYYQSAIRRLLNDGFYNSAFTAAQRNLIISKTVVNTAASSGYGSNIYACQNSQDKLFLLSQSEVTNAAYFGENSLLNPVFNKRVSDYARCKGVFAELSGSATDGNGYWWLRSPCNDDSNRVQYVTTNGLESTFGELSNYTNSTLFGVVPAMWLTICSEHVYGSVPSCCGKACLTCGGGYVAPVGQHNLNGQCVCAYCGRTQHALTTYCKHGDYIYFGEYPTTIKNVGVCVGSYTIDGYYLGSDGCRYAKKIAQPYGYDYRFSDGSELKTGRTYYYKVEPIKWRVLLEDGSKATMLCETVIDAKRFDDNSNRYNESELRSWLNGALYQSAFSVGQKSIIDTTAVDNSPESTGNPNTLYACATTNDKIYLAGYYEIVTCDYYESLGRNGLIDFCKMQNGVVISSPDPEIVAAAKNTSDYARGNGCWINTETNGYGSSWWWLRSPDAEGMARLLPCPGVVTDSSYGVLPMCRISLS